MSDQPNNAAARARELFSSALAQNGDRSVLDVWLAVFQLNGPQRPPDREVVRRLMVLAGELDSVVTFARAQRLRARQWESQINAAHNALCLGNLQQGWKGYAGELTNTGTLTALDWLSATMPDEGEMAVEPAELQSLRTDLESLGQRVAASALPRDARALLSRAIQQMIRTLDDVRVAGIGAIRRQAAEIVADLAANETAIKEAGDAPELNLFANLFSRFAIWAPTIARLTSWAGTALDVAAKAKQLTDGSPQ